MTAESTPAGFWRRVGAKFCDFAIIFALQLLVMQLIALLDVFVAPGAAVLGIFVLGALSQIFYFAYGNANGRRTWGYQWAGLRLETEQGTPLSLGRNGWRSLLSGAAGALLIYGGFLDFAWIIFNPRRRCGHDLLCGSRVVAIAPLRPLLLCAVPVSLLMFVSLWTSHAIWPVSLRSYYVPAGSMEPTVRLNDRLLANLLVYRLQAPRNGEIAIFVSPRLPQMGLDGDVDFIKRVVGTPGDVVTIVNRQLFRDGKPVREPYVDWSNNAPETLSDVLHISYDMKIVGGAVYSRDYFGPNQPGKWRRYGMDIDEKKQRAISAAKAEAVPADQFLMLGDHRSNSNDSHVFGFVPLSAFEARALTTYWPHWKSLR